MTDTFQIVLKDVNKYDTYASREFDLLLGSDFPIGRASKNATKRELMPAPNNAYIDSPVISREHAVLSANTTSGAPQLYITDKGSMHGTMVNGHPLAPNTPKQLSAGDILQFGVDVNRNEEFFVARKYTFDFRLSRPFSLGFTVPDADSEEEEVNFQERRGSQLHPLVIDESDSASEQSDDDQADVTMAMIEGVEPSEAAEIHSVYEEYPDPAMQTAIDEEAYSEEEPAIEYSKSEDGEVDFDSDGASVGSSEPEYNSSEREVPDSEDEEPLAMGAYQQMAQSYKQPSMTNPPTIQPRDIFTADEATGNQAPELPSIGVFNRQYDNHALPPRQAVAKPAPWTSLVHFGQHGDNQSWYSDDMPTLPSYMGTNFGDRPSLFGLPPTLPVPELLDTMAGPSSHGCRLAPVNSAEHLQTPPPMSASDVTTSPTLQTNNRTKVSIEEIIEEQPLTPTSVNETKRKAEVLDEEETPEVVEPVVALEDTVGAASQTAVTDAAAQAATIIAQRPKKQPRSIIRKALNTAAYPLLGAAGAVASFTLLSTLPDAFFGA